MYRTFGGVSYKGNRFSCFVTFGFRSLAGPPPPWPRCWAIAVIIISIFFIVVVVVSPSSIVTDRQIFVPRSSRTIAMYDGKLQVTVAMASTIAKYDGKLHQQWWHAAVLLTSPRAFGWRHQQSIVQEHELEINAGQTIVISITIIVAISIIITVIIIIATILIPPAISDGKSIPLTSHTLNPVGIAVGGAGLPDNVQFRLDLPKAGLANVTATYINLLGFEAPSFYQPSLVHTLWWGGRCGWFLIFNWMIAMENTWKVKLATLYTTCPQTLW